MFNWLRELLEIRSEFRERKYRLLEEQKVCPACEILKTELNMAHARNIELLNKLTKEETPVEKPVVPMETLPLRRHLSWKHRQQILEADDRIKAQAMRNAAQPDSVEDLEKELDVVAKEREHGTTANSATNSK